MGYKHSPANAKLSAFMQKMNNTSKSPVRQNKSEYDLRRNADLDAQSNMAQTSSNVVTSKPRVTKGTDSKGDFTTTEYDVTTTKKFKGTGTDRDAWDKNKDGVKGKYSSFEEFSKAAQAYRDKMTKNTQRISETVYDDKPKQPTQKSSIPSTRTGGVYEKMIDVEVDNPQGGQYHWKTITMADGSERHVQRPGPGKIITQKRVNLTPEEKDRARLMTDKELGEAGFTYTNLDSRRTQSGVSDQEARQKAFVSGSSGDKNVKLSDDYAEAQRIKTTKQETPAKMMKKHSDRFASPAKQGRSGKNFRPSKETRKDIKEAKKKQKAKIKHAQKTGTETTDLYAKDVVFKVGMPKGVDSF